MCNRRKYTARLILGVLTTLFFIAVQSHGQDIRVVETNGAVAVISGGKNAGLRTGDTVRIMRMRNNSWKEVSRATITEVMPDMARIEIVEGSPPVNFKPGDYVMKVKLAGGLFDGDIAFDELADANFSLLSPYRTQNVYLGPLGGAFVPLGTLGKELKTSFGCGGMVGFKFRDNLDISLRFFYSQRKTEWYFWNIQVIGRRYFAKGWMLDMGYGIGYPYIAAHYNKRLNEEFDSPLLRLGFIGGIACAFPVSPGMWFELGCLMHYYPNFYDRSAQFLTLQGSLIL
jgi:hypothetical protein